MRSQRGVYMCGRNPLAFWHSPCGFTRARARGVCVVCNIFVVYSRAQTSASAAASFFSVDSMYAAALAASKSAPGLKQFGACSDVNVLRSWKVSDFPPTKNGERAYYVCPVLINLLRQSFVASGTIF